METSVAKILSDTQVVLAAGREHGVDTGQEFIIYELGDDIPDPETGQSLGKLEIVKGRVVVVHPMDRMSIAQTTRHTVERTITRPPVLLSGPFFPRQETHTIEQVDKLTVDEHDDDYTKRRVVKVGDKARSIGG